MSLLCFHSFFRQVAPTLPSRLLNAVTWTLLLIVTVTVASVAPGVTFLLAISPPSSFSSKQPCSGVGGDFVRIPLDFPTEIVCLPQHVVMNRSNLDFFLPTLFAALVVGVSTCLLRSVASV